MGADSPARCRSEQRRQCPSRLYFQPCQNHSIVRNHSRMVGPWPAIVERQKVSPAVDRLAAIEEQRLFPLHIAFAVEQQRSTKKLRVFQVRVGPLVERGRALAEILAGRVDGRMAWKIEAIQAG